MKNTQIMINSLTREETGKVDTNKMLTNMSYHEIKESFFQ